MALGGLEAALARINSLDGVTMTVGVQSQDGREVADGDDLNLAGIARVNEFGAPEANIRARPWLRTAAANDGRKWAKAFRRAVTAARKGESPAPAYRLTGQAMVASVKTSLLDGRWKPNAPSTIAKKSTSSGVGDQPLFDTGRLVNSQRAAVEIPGQSPEVVA